MPLDKPRSLPELHFANADGKDLSLGDFRGRVVLLNLWATWCVPCRKEMPTLDRLDAKLGGPGFEVVALSIDRRGLAAVQPFFKELGIKALRIYLDQSGKAAFTLDAPGLPTTLLIDRDGREIARKIGPAEWDSPEIEEVIRQHLSRKASAESATRDVRSGSDNVQTFNADEVPK
ncbi:MAG: TlpA family protein disulfide reductase [Alphaproteobacteria bacterium]|nr:TlpA family protein disulfide reductase [Alphaproteobacteria bacterium]